MGTVPLIRTIYGIGGVAGLWRTTYDCWLVGCWGKRIVVRRVRASTVPRNEAQLEQPQSVSSESVALTLCLLPRSPLRISKVRTNDHRDGGMVRLIPPLDNQGCVFVVLLASEGAPLCV